MGRLTRMPGRLTAAPRRVAPAPKVALPIYQSAEWRALIASIVVRRGRRCEACPASGCRVYGDHIVELRDGGKPFDERNVQLLCATCHGRKTAERRRARVGLSMGGGRKSPRLTPP